MRTLNPLLIGLAASALLFGCANGTETLQPDDGGPASSSGTNTGGGGVGGDETGGGGDGGMGPCAVDCSTIATPQCLVSVCNEGQFEGTIGECVIVNDANDTPCDDGMFCTIQDTCQEGQCTGGPQNDCGMDPAECVSITCDEASASCGTEPANDGSACTPAALCEVNGQCLGGLCVGTPNDCFFAPVPDCEVAVCDPMDGMCKGQPDPTQDGDSCIDQMDLCTDGKTCSAGSCLGGFPKDCSALDIGCQNGVCDPMNGNCVGMAVPVGGQCNDGVGQCETGTCDMNQNCVLSPVMNGTQCDDFSTCTINDQCTAGVCSGTVDPMCTTYFEETFEVCPPPGWSLNQEWECGAPTLVGPMSAFQGMNVLGTDLDAEYENGESYEIMFAQTPPIGLGTAVQPVMAYQHYVDTEGSVYDGYNVKISTDGGMTFSVVQTVTPPYPLNINMEPAYGGHPNVWEQVLVDLSAYVGQQVIIRFSFRSDTSVTYPGVYIDDIQVGEADAIPVTITTQSLPNGLENTAYSVQMEQTGGTGNGTWTIQSGTNIGWLSMSPSGLLSGTPVAADVGPVTVTIRHEEPSNPTNFDEATYMFTVQSTIYTDDIEAACPGNWTLGGEWQCGAPMSGPAAAFSGMQVIGTALAGNYSNNLSWATNTASSGPISLAGTTAPQLQFQVWYQTEGFSFDGFNVKVSTDGGMTYNILNLVTPAYDLTIDGQSAWGGQNGQQWTTYMADLSAYAGMNVHIQFGMRSDGSATYPGVYIDNVAVTD